MFNVIRFQDQFEPVRMTSRGWQGARPAADLSRHSRGRLIVRWLRPWQCSVNRPVIRAYAMSNEPMTSKSLAPRLWLLYSPIGENSVPSRQSGMPAEYDSETSYVLQSSLIRKGPRGFPPMVDTSEPTCLEAQCPTCGMAPSSLPVSVKHVPFRGPGPGSRLPSGQAYERSDQSDVLCPCPRSSACPHIARGMCASVGGRNVLKLYGDCQLCLSDEVI